MKILLLSDTHGDIRTLSKALEKFGRNADIIVHCGDGTRGDAQFIIDNCKHCMVLCVKGNCDFGTMMKDIEFLNICNHKIMITHSHLFNSKMGLANLSYKAEENDCDMVFFGHTHIPTDETLGNVRLINPGTAFKYNATCAVVEMDDAGNVLVNHINIK